jgi:hypothetical protein
MMGEIHRIMLGDVCGLHALGMFVADLFKSRWQLEAENLFLRHQTETGSIGLRACPPRGRLRRLSEVRVFPANSNLQPDRYERASGSKKARKS